MFNIDDYAQPDGFDNAQICLNGHIITSSIEDNPTPQSKFCYKCGEETITHCNKCKAPIRGHFRRTSGISVAGMILPKYCHNCGLPYPWTESKLQAVHDLTNEIEGITEEERNILNESVGEFVRETPQIQLAATRFKRVLAKVGQEAGQAIKSIITDITSETVKKLIWP